MATLTSLGIGSGILTSELLDQLKGAETAARITPFTAKKQNNLSQQSSLASLISLVSSYKSSVSSMLDSSVYSARTSSVNGTGIKATVAAGVPAQEITVKVDQMAKSQIIALGPSYRSEESTISTTNSRFNFKVGEKEYGVNITAGMTLKDFAQAITDATGGEASASVMKTGTGSEPYQVVINSKLTGVENAASIGNKLTSGDIKVGSISLTTNTSGTNASSDLVLSVRSNVTAPNGANTAYIPINLTSTPANASSEENAAALKKAIEDALAAYATRNPGSGVDQVKVNLIGDGKRIEINDTRGGGIYLGEWSNNGPSGDSTKAKDFGFKETYAQAQPDILTDTIKGGKLTGSFNFTLNSAAGSYTMTFDLGAVTSAGNTAEQNAKAIVAEFQRLGMGAQLEDGNKVGLRIGGIENVQFVAPDDAGQKALNSLGIAGGSHLPGAQFTSNMGYSIVQEAQDAKITYNGITVTRATNTIKDLVSGVDLELTGEHTGSDFATIRVADDYKPVYDGIQAMVDAYNAVMDQLSTVTKYDPDTKIAGIFQGDGTIRGLLTDMRRMLSQSENGKRLADFGVALNDANRLSFDQSAFKEAYEKNPETAQAFFRGKINSTGEQKGGLLSSFETLLNSYLQGGGGTLNAYQSSLANMATRLGDEQTKAQATLDRRYEILANRFSAYDTMIAQTNNNFNALSQIIAQSTKSSN